MSEFLSCVCGVLSWPSMRIAPECGRGLHAFDPFDQGCLAHQSPASKLEIGEWGNTGDHAVEQVAEVSFTTAEKPRALASGEHFRQAVEQRSTRYAAERGRRCRHQHSSWLEFGQTHPTLFSSIHLSRSSRSMKTSRS